MNELALEPSADSVTVQVVNAVADETGRDPKALPPLHDVVDTDALETIVAREPTTSLIGGESDAVEVTIEYAGRVVTVSSTGEVDISEEAAASLRATPT
ncbi:HalOD1 output domain-containing protein [Halorussus ruber]|uniref:HalOD1 output domain-containing protein n=1 Tax=Halorussus ruber TaxID=1126238 RepID=UPI001091CFAE|nr:HalOD1 output domain-containing protein [Halorussus ruber]